MGTCLDSAPLDTPDRRNTRDTSDATQPSWTALRDALHPDCVVCSPRNPRGLGVGFTAAADGAGVTATVACDPTLEGYVGVLHGGVVCALLDGAMANCLFVAGRPGRTGRLTVRFRHPVEARGHVTVSARLVRWHGRLADLTADVRQDGRVVATATAQFMALSTATR